MTLVSVCVSVSECDPGVSRRSSKVNVSRLYTLLCRHGPFSVVSVHLLHV